MPSADKRQRKKENARIAREAREAAAKRRRRLKTARNMGIAVAIFVIVIVVINTVGSGGSKKASTTTTTTTPAPTTTLPPKVKLTGFVANPAKTYSATLKTNFGTIVMALDAKSAPKAAGRFIELARGHFYDGLTFHRIAKDFVIQGGDPTGTGEGGSGNKPIVGEVPKDHYPVGTLAAAKTGTEPAGSFDCQFFIVTGAQGATLPNDYARFGLVTSGLDVAQQIAKLVPSSGDGPPTKKVTIDSITITQS